MLQTHLVAKTRPQALAENQITLQNVRITVLTDRLFRIECNPNGRFCDQATQSVWFRDFEKVPFSVEKPEHELKIITRQAELRWRGSIAESTVLLHGSSEEISLSNQENLLGTYRTLDCCDGSKWIPSDGDMSKAMDIRLEPGVISKNGAAVLDDSASLLLKSDGMLMQRPFPEQDIYIFAYGTDYRGAVKALYALCGAAPLIPRFALGNWWSRYHAYTEKEYLQTLERFEARNIPLTVATVDMDWHWSETLDERKQITANGKNDALHGGCDGWTGYSWNTDLFPDYRRFLRRLHEKGLHVTLNLHPALGVRYFEDMYRQMAEAMGIDPETEQKIPFDMTDSRFINAYFQILHNPYEKDGVDFWWIDWQQGSQSLMEGLDPLWALNHYHFLDNGQAHMPLILSRYCGVGSHRYPLGFSGDTHVTWKTLHYLPYFTAAASNIGYTWWSHDIGGHMCGCKDDELYVRFVQFGVFSPINRLHSTNSPTFTKEPWAYGNGAGLIAEAYLRLRHRMIPFLYSASYETTMNGRALTEPLYYAWPEAEEAYQYPNMYLFGGQLLAAPVTVKSEEQGLAKVPVWLPEGRWTDFFTGEEYAGGQEITLIRWLDEMPVLIKEGGFFVLDGRKYTNDTENPDYLRVYVTNGNGSYVLHEDKNGDRIDTVFTSHAENGLQKISIFCQNLQADKRTVELRFCNILRGDVSVTADGRFFQAAVDDNGRLKVVLKDAAPEITYEVLVRYDDQTAELRMETLRRTLTKLQLPNAVKEDLFRNLCSAGHEEFRRYTENTDLPEIVKMKLLELNR